jgi:hypothetical protein
MKKGILPLWVSLIFAFLAIALLLIFYFVFLQGGRAPQQIDTQESFAVGANNVLINYLNSPVAVQGETVTFADLLRLWYNDKKTYEPVLTAATTDFLAHSAFTYKDSDGTQRKRAFWLALHEPREGAQTADRVLLMINAPQVSKTGPASAQSIVAVSDDRVIIAKIWSTEVEQ